MQSLFETRKYEWRSVDGDLDIDLVSLREFGSYDITRAARACL